MISKDESGTEHGSYSIINYPVDGLFDNWDLITDRFEQPTCTMLSVERLASPKLLVEIKQMAVR